MIRIPGEPIGPGETVDIVVRAMDDGGLLAGLAQERSMELPSGPHVIARGEVLAYPQA